MNTVEPNQTNQAAFRQMAGFIKESFPRGQFLAITNGKIVANAASFGELDSSLKALGKDSVDVLVVQAGVEYPESAVIFI